MCADGGREALASGGPPLGIIERPHYLEELAALAQGDVLAIYTDGVTEAMNSAGEEYGPARLADAISRARAGSAGEIQRAVTEDLVSFGGRQLSDDCTLVIIRAA